MPDTHTGHRMPRVVALQQASVTDLDRLGRLTNKCHHDDLRALLIDESGAIQGGVLTGLAVTAAASGSLAVDVSAGVAFANNASGLGDATLDSAYRRIHLESASADVTLAAADPTNDRIDTISVGWAQGTSQTESRNIRPSAGAAFVPTNTATMQGPSITVTVTTGTPAGSPSAPSTPANHVKLGQVLVPAAATVAGDLTVSTTGRQTLPTVQRPGTLAGGTSVDGNLTVSAQLIVDTVNASGNIDTDAGVSANSFFSDSTSDTLPVLTARAGASGTPDVSDDVHVFHVERGSEPNAKVVWDEGEDGFLIDSGNGRLDGLVVGGFEEPSGPTAINAAPMAIWAERASITVTGGSPTETHVISWANNVVTGVGGGGLPVFVFAQIQNHTGTSVAPWIRCGLAAAGSGTTVTIGTGDGSNLIASDILNVDFLLVGRLA